MKKIYKILLFSLLGVFVLAFGASAQIPNMVLTLQSDGDNVQLQIAADNNVPVNLYYTKTGVGLTIFALGTTNSSGAFTTTVSSASLSIASASTVYIMANGQRSADFTWPNISSSSSALTLSQTSVVTTVGQNTNITATNYNSSNPLYLSNNSNPQIANISINGSQISVSAINNGVTTATICKQGTTNACASIYITVQTSGATVLTFSQSSVTIAPGQSVPINIYGGTGYYMIQNNSNSSLIQTSINGSAINLSVNSSAGSGSVTVCSTNNSSCGIINVTAGTTSSSAISFSQQNVTLSVGQSTNVSITGGSTSTYYISNNSNPNILQATISGNTLFLTGNVNGSSSVTVCSSIGSCGIVNVAVNYVSTGGKIALSQTYLNLLVGQTLSVTITGGTAPYNTPISSNSIYTASISGNVLSVYGRGAGSGIVDVCSAEGGCIILNVTVSGSGSSTLNQPYFSQNNLTIYPGQSSTVSVSGTGGYYISNNSNSSVATGSISGINIIVNALTAGSTNINVCQTGGQCNVLYVTVSASTTTAVATTFLTFSISNPTVLVGSTTTVSVYGTSSANYSVLYNSNSNALSPTMSGAVLNLYGRSNGPAVVVVCDQINNCGAVLVAVGNVAKAQLSTASCPVCTTVTCPVTTCPTSTTSKYIFSRLLGLGDTGDDVLELQKKLKSEGVYTGSITGTFGNLTFAGVKAYQAKYGIRQTGNVGALTMAQLNK